MQRRPFFGASDKPSAEFAREYAIYLEHARAALEREIEERRNKPPEPPSDADDLKQKLARAKEELDRKRLASRPSIESITDEEIADVLAMNPQFKSGEREFDRLLGKYESSIPICADHARWLVVRGDDEEATREYQRCMKLDGTSEEQRRYFQLQLQVLRDRKYGVRPPAGATGVTLTPGE